MDARNVRHIVLMRPINSMIEFKQIIGRGTRLYNGKDYFTIHDFVKAHHLFSDPEWDGEPVEPQPRVLTTHGNPPAAEGERAPANRGRVESASRDQGAPAPAHDGQLVLERPRAADAGRAVPEVAVPWVSRTERAAAAKAATGAELTDKRNAFMGFVLAQYLAQGQRE